MSESVRKVEDFICLIRIRLENRTCECTESCERAGDLEEEAERRRRKETAAAVVMVTDGMETEKRSERAIKNIGKQNKRVRDRKCWALCHNLIMLLFRFHCC